MYFSEREGRKYICDNASVFNGICSSRTELVKGDFAGRFVASYRCLLQFLGASSSFSFTFFIDRCQRCLLTSPSVCL